MPDIKSILRHFFISITYSHDSAHLTGFKNLSGVAKQKTLW